jgi:hypothetical protein
MLQQLPALTSLSLVYPYGYGRGWLVNLYDYLQHADNIETLALYTQELPSVYPPSLRSLSIAESALESIGANLQDLKSLWSIRHLTIDSISDDDHWEVAMYELVCTLCPHVERLVCPSPLHEIGCFPASLVHLHITTTRLSCLDSLFHLCKAIAAGAYPCLLSFVLEIDWHEVMEDIWEMRWEPTPHASRCNYCILVENTEESGVEETEEGDELIDYDAVEGFMLEYFYLDLCAMLDKAQVKYKIPLPPGWLPYSQPDPILNGLYVVLFAYSPCYITDIVWQCRKRPRIVPKHPPFTKTYKQHKLEAGVDGMLVLGGLADIATRCSRRPFKPCFPGSFPQRSQARSTELWEKGAHI